MGKAGTTVGFRGNDRLKYLGDRNGKQIATVVDEDGKSGHAMNRQSILARGYWEAEPEEGSVWSREGDGWRNSKTGQWVE